MRFKETNAEQKSMTEHWILLCDAKYFSFKNMNPFPACVCVCCSASLYPVHSASAGPKPIFPPFSFSFPLQRSLSLFILLTRRHQRKPSHTPRGARGDAWPWRDNGHFFSCTRCSYRSPSARLWSTSPRPYLLMCVLINSSLLSLYCILHMTNGNSCLDPLPDFVWDHVCSFCD